MSRPRLSTPPRSSEHPAEPHDAVFSCELCKRTLTIPEAQNYSNATLALMAMKQGWSLHPQVLCAIDLATQEAYRRPVPRRNGRAVRPRL